MRHFASTAPRAEPLAGRSSHAHVTAAAAALGRPTPVAPNPTQARVLDVMSPVSDHPGSGASKRRTQIPPTPQTFNDLDTKTMAELQVLEADELTRASVVLQQEAVRIFREMDRTEKQQNLASCMSNIDSEAEIATTKQQISDLVASTRESERAVSQLEARVSSARAKKSALAIALKLEQGAADALTRSETVAAAFTEGTDSPPLGESAMPRFRWIGGHTTKYVQARQEHHTLLATAQLLKFRGFQPDDGSAPMPHAAMV